MKLAVLSGKGGAGKTLVAVNLAVAARARYVDCDIEEPNGHLFLQPDEVTVEPVAVQIPTVDANRCTACRTCVDFCRFGALAMIDGRVEVFAELCKSCGGCAVLCPEGAISEFRRTIGHIHQGMVGEVDARGGVMRPGIVSGVPIVKQLLAGLPSDELSIIDGPPGASCPAVEVARSADLCLLVAEPTKFGVHNMRLMYALTQAVGRPCGVLINKAVDDDTQVEDACAELGVPVVGRLPYDPEVARLGSQGHLLADEGGRLASQFAALAESLRGVLS